MAGRKILLVDDEVKIVRIVRAYLERDGFQVLTAADGRLALDLVRRERPDMVVLDLMLPEVSGWDVCRALRREPMTADVPIIMLTARDDVADRIVGLELGADDYVVKPFDPKELLARVHAVLRRAGGRSTGLANGVVQRGELRLDMDRHEAWRGAELLALTPTEFELLATLVRQPGRVFTRLQLLEAIQGQAFEGYERAIDSHVKNLRRKLEPDPRHPRHVLTVFGVGYKLGDNHEPAPS
ncbi:MAG: response regulator transcription factor [Chloroflexi bacterium]|nr:response regulator transcription factor [Chloroflexota bacterium]